MPRLLIFLLLAALCGSAIWPNRVLAADVLIVCDPQLRPVSEIVAGIRKTLNARYRVVSLAELQGSLQDAVEAEDAKVVVALGKKSLAEALSLPVSVPVIYDLVVVPPQVSRPNTTGFYMATPAREYAEVVRTYLRAIKKIAVIGSRSQLNLLARGDLPQQNVFGVRNSVEFVDRVRQLDEGDADAIMLMPDSALLTPAAMDEALLNSFKKNIPLLGISEQNVKEGALFALVVDTVNVGRLIGETANRVLRGGSVAQLPPAPPRKFNLYLNASTASRMGIKLPQEMVRLAKRVYQ